MNGQVALILDRLERLRSDLPVLDMLWTADPNDMMMRRDRWKLP